jgi:hypothetical protein
MADIGHSLVWKVKPNCLQSRADTEYQREDRNVTLKPCVTDELCRF